MPPSFSVANVLRLSHIRGDFYAGGSRSIEMLIQRLKSLSYDKREIQMVGMQHCFPPI